jgi:hypothetical protein
MTFDELAHELSRCDPWTCAECRRERGDEEVCEMPEVASG